MANLTWIQLASQIVENTAWPLDAKQKLNTDNRLALSTTQRWLWMIVFDTDEWKWKILANEPWTTETADSDWNDFISWTTNSFDIANEKFTLDTQQTDYDLQYTPISWSLSLYINWLENIEWEHFTLDWKTIKMDSETNYLDWHIMSVKYFY